MPKIRKKSPSHENADTNITCDFGDGDISAVLGVDLHTRTHARTHAHARTHTHTHTHTRPATS